MNSVKHHASPASAPAKGPLPSDPGQAIRRGDDQAAHRAGHGARRLDGMMTEMLTAAAEVGGEHLRREGKALVGAHRRGRCRRMQELHTGWIAEVFESDIMMETKQTALYGPDGTAGPRACAAVPDLLERRDRGASPGDYGRST